MIPSFPNPCLSRQQLHNAAFSRAVPHRKSVFPFTSAHHGLLMRALQQYPTHQGYIYSIAVPMELVKLNYRTFHLTRAAELRKIMIPHGGGLLISGSTLEAQLRVYRQSKIEESI